MRARSYLYAPGHRADLLDKALAGDADVVVADLEDGVPRDRKAAARDNVLAALRSLPSKPLHVRVDRAGEEQLADDLAALTAAGATLIRLPKCEGPGDVLRAAAAVERAAAGGPAPRLGCLIESARGVEQAHAIATAHALVASISLGEADLGADLGVHDDAGMAYARSRVVVAARAAGLPAPSQSVFTAVRDLDGLRRTSLAGRSLGFFGRSLIHPAQIPVVHEAYAPSEAEVAAAAALLDGIERMEEEGSFLLDDGRLVDRATVERARALLEEQR